MLLSGWIAALLLTECMMSAPPAINIDWSKNMFWLLFSFNYKLACSLHTVHAEHCVKLTGRIGCFHPNAQCQATAAQMRLFLLAPYYLAHREFSMSRHSLKYLKFLMRSCLCFQLHWWAGHSLQLIPPQKPPDVIDQILTSTLGF